MDARRVRLQLRFLTVALKAARRNERADVAERASAILHRVALEIRPEDEPQLANLIEEVRAELEGALNEP